MVEKKEGVYVNARSITAGGGSFIGTDTMDLEELQKKLGRYVQATIAKPKEPKTPESRYVKFTASEAKYLPKKGEGGGKGSSSKGSDSDEIL